MSSPVVEVIKMIKIEIVITIYVLHILIAGVRRERIVGLIIIISNLLGFYLQPLGKCVRS
jgi:hypothetical protein